MEKKRNFEKRSHLQFLDSLEGEKSYSFSRGVARCTTVEILLFIICGVGIDYA